MKVLKHIDSNTIDASANLVNFRRDTSGVFYAIYGDDKYAVPIVGWGIDESGNSHAMPLVLHIRFGLIPVWAAKCHSNNFSHVAMRGDQ